MAVKIQIRNGTAAEWTSANPILAVGELAIESDTMKFKIGDGITAWNSLLYATQGEAGPQGPQGIPGETGPTGLTGATGKGIASIIKTSGTGAAGTIDTYTITFSDSTTTTFNVYNGADGAGATIVIDNLTSTSATSALSANQGKVLNDLVSTKAIKASYTATLPSASWTGSAAPYSKAVTVTGILLADKPLIDIVPSGTYATDVAMETNWSQIYRMVTSADTITFYAHSVPTADIPLQILVVR